MEGMVRAGDLWGAAWPDRKVVCGRGKEAVGQRPPLARVERVLEGLVAWDRGRYPLVTLMSLTRMFNRLGSAAKGHSI